MRQLEETLHLLAAQDGPIDSGELIDRIELDLAEEGVPVVAWDRSRTMQTQERASQTTPARPAKSFWAFATAVVVVVAAIAIPVWLLSGDQPGEAVSGSDSVFTWEDDPSKWVTAEEMKAMFQSLSKRFAGVDLDETEVVVEGSSPVGEERAWSGAEIRPANWQWVYYPEDQDLWQGSVYEARLAVPDLTDPRLPEGVVFAQDWGWGYVLKGPNSDEVIAIDLMPPLELLPSDSHPEREGPYYEMYLEFASWMLRELGWAS